jgi:hypothetical protein
MGVMGVRVDGVDANLEQVKQGLHDSTTRLTWRQGFRKTTQEPMQTLR